MVLRSGPPPQSGFAGQLPRQGGAICCGARRNAGPVRTPAPTTPPHRWAQGPMSPSVRPQRLPLGEGGWPKVRRMRGDAGLRMTFPLPGGRWLAEGSVFIRGRILRFAQNDITCSVILRRLFSRVILRPQAEGSAFMRGRILRFAQNDITCSVILRRLFSRVILRPQAEGSAFMRGRILRFAQNDVTCSVILRRLFSRVILRPQAEGSVSPVSPVSPPSPTPLTKFPGGCTPACNKLARNGER